ncbi:MAG: response regulator [Syntrophorhabdales bacterium]|jgi:DNA-binding NtrC family response regulator
MGYVVVVDDEHMVEEFLEAFLRRADYRDKSFNDPRRAFDFIKENRDDIRLVIADLTMPHMTGVQLGEEMMKVVSGIPVILFTGQDPPPLVENLSCNVKIVLQKPFRREEFIRAVESVIGQAQDVV